MPVASEVGRSHHENQVGPPQDLIEGLNRALGQFRSEERPMTKKIPEIHEAIRTHDTIIIEGQTGSGKSTVAPLAILEESLRMSPNARIAMTQPRRPAAKDIVVGHDGNGLADLVGNNYVGYRYRGESTVKPQTRLEVMMERSLLNEIMSDPTLGKYKVVILDEAHERSADLDLLMPLLKEAQKLRAQQGDSLKIVLASATLDIEKFVNFFGKTTTVKSEGVKHTIHESFENEQVNLADVPEKTARKAAEIIAEGEEEGDILIFLPGRGEIRKTREELRKLFPNNEIDIEELRGGEKGNSEKLNRKTTKRAIFLGTNVVETSVTPKTVRIVIDPGYMRVSEYDQVSQINRLVTKKHTQGNARQRRGRVGRLGEGWVHYYFPQPQLLSREPHLEPQIFHTDISMQILMLKGLGKNVNDPNFFFENPGEERINHAIKKLQSLGAVDENGNITADVGRRMLEIEAEDPIFAKLFIEAEKRGCQYDVAVLAGIMQSEKSIFDYNPKEAPFSKKYEKYITTPGNDFATLINIWNDYVRNKENKSWGSENGIDTSTLEKSVSNGKRMLGSSENSNDRLIDESGQNLQNIMSAIINGLKNNLIIATGSGYQKAIGNINVQISRDSAAQGAQAEYLLAGKFNYNESTDTTYAEYNMQIPKEWGEQIKKMALEDDISNTEAITEDESSKSQETTIHESQETTHESQLHSSGHGHNESHENHDSHTSHNSHDHHDGGHTGEHHAEGHAAKKSKFKISKVFLKIDSIIAKSLQKVKDKVTAFLKKLKSKKDGTGHSSHH